MAALIQALSPGCVRYSLSQRDTKNTKKKKRLLLLWGLVRV